MFYSELDLCVNEGWLCCVQYVFSVEIVDIQSISL
jgi:hypothetical protein